jgi:hypothetical protein
MFENIIKSEIIDRCLAAALFCIELGNDRRANDLMKAEFREVAREVSHWQLSGETKACLFLAPMEEELVSRHGQDLGRMLYVDFVDAFWIQAWIDVPLDVEKLERNVCSSTDRHDQLLTDRTLRRRIATQDYFSCVNNN